MARRLLTLREIRERARANSRKQYNKRKNDPDFKAKKKKSYAEWYEANKEEILAKRKRVRELKKQIRLL